jgi:antitoxin VapB
MYMALHIQDPETDRLARELSAVTGETITQAVNFALRERLKHIGAQTPSEAEYIARIKEITARVAAMPILDTRTEDEILGYNDQGLFD